MIIQSAFSISEQRQSANRGGSEEADNQRFYDAVYAAAGDCVGHRIAGEWA